MAQAVPAVVAFFAQIFTTQTIQRIAVAIAINALSRMLQPKSKDASADRSSRFEKRRDPSPYRDVILGTAITAGTFVDATAYGTDNMFYCEIIKLADHECDGLVAAYAGGRQLTINGDGSVQEYIESGTPRMWIYFQPGAWGETTHSEVLTAFAGRYTANDRGRGVCRVVLKCDMRSDKLFPSKSPPDITFAVRGAKIYSPRLDTSLGGSQTWGNYATYAWTNNLADIAYNVARGIFVYGGASPERLAGGAYDAEELPLASWAAEGNACEVLVPLKAGGNIKRYTGGLIFSTNEELESILADLAAGAAGFVLDLGGTLIFQAGVARTPVATLTDSDFIAGKLRRTWRQRARERFNTVTGRFTDPALRYQQNSLPIRRSTADIAQDNNEERVETMNLGVVQANAQGQRVMEIRRRQNRRNDMFQVEMPPAWQHLEAGDWITYTSARRGWTKNFVLLPAELKTSPEDMLVSAFTMVEVNAADFSWNAATDELDVTNPAGVGPGSVPDATLSGFVPVASANSSATDLSPAIDVTWTPPSDPTIRTVAVDYKRAAASTWLTQSFDASLGSGQISGLAGGSWQVRARPITQPLRPGTATSVVTVVLQTVTSGSASGVAPGAVRVGTDIFPGTGSTPLPGSQLLNEFNPSVNNSVVDDSFNFLAASSIWNFYGIAATRSKVVSSGNLNQLYMTATGTPALNSPLGVAQAPQAAFTLVPGQRVEVSAHVGGIGLGLIDVYAFWYDANGAFISGSLAGRLLPVGTAVGGFNLSNYVRIGGIVTPPGGAQYAGFAAYGYTDGTTANPSVRITTPLISPVSADQSVLSPYSKGFDATPGADPTGQNTAAAIIGQGTGATANNLTGLNPTEGAKLGGIEAGADVTANAVPSLEGPASVTFDVDSGGALSPGSQVPRTLQFVRKRGNTDVSTTTTWSIISPVNVTLGTITNGGVNITAIAVGNSSFTVRSVRDGVTIDLLVTVVKNTIAAGGATAKRATPDVNSNSTLNNASWQTLGTVTINSCPAGNLFFDGSYLFVASGTGTCDHKARITVDGVLVGSELASQNTVTGGTPSAADFTPLFEQVIPVSAGNRTIAVQVQRTVGTGTFVSATRLDVSAFPT